VIAAHLGASRRVGHEHFDWFCKATGKKTLNYKAYVMALVATLGVKWREKITFAFDVFDAGASGNDRPGQIPATGHVTHDR
jgi:hypothetical protein